MKRKLNPIIYKTTNLVNGKIYIGQDSYDNISYLGSGVRLHDAIKKYGKDNFVKEILERCTKELLNDREQYWIAFYNSIDPEIGYNLTPGGEGNQCKSWKEYLSDLQLQKRRDRLIRYNKSEERRNAARARRLGKTYEQIFGASKAELLKRKCSERFKINNISKPRKLSEKTKKLLSESNKLTYHITFPDSTSMTFKGQAAVIEYFNILNEGKNTINRISPYAVLENRKPGYKCNRI